MRTISRPLIKATALVLLFALTTLSSPGAAEDPPALKSVPYVTPRGEQPLTSAARQFLLDRNPEKARVWVHFTDKNVFTQAQFDSASADISLSDKVLRRRARVGRDRVLFADLPVRNDYVRAVTDLGGKHRRTSRWLNAASFDVPVSRLDQVAGLPFVVSVRPVAGGRSVPALPVPETDASALPQSSAELLNYGTALYQLEQINVPALHRRGLSGAGVTLAIFDTGYRKTHEAFAQHYADGRVLAEYDFIFDDNETSNEEEDDLRQWNHGTICWSVAGGSRDGRLYGPAYGANFILVKSEDVRSELPIEEDNWVAGFEWVETLGADVITSSLAYLDWYDYSDLDGATATTTVAVNTAAGLGIVVCNAMANEGPFLGSLAAPADACDMVAVGAVDASGTIAVFSSRGPTYDGRTKPEVCARGVSTACASAGGDATYGYADGTSLATPLVGGVACLLIEAHPDHSPEMIRQALMETACHAASPDNNYGWGVVDAERAANWGAEFESDITLAEVPFTANFTYTSGLTVTSWAWSFGDGESAFVENPSHQYTEPGVYSVTLAVETDLGSFTSERNAYILALQDTLSFETDSAFAGEELVISVNLTNTQPVGEILLPFRIDKDLAISLKDVTLGERIAAWDNVRWVSYSSLLGRYVVRLERDDESVETMLPAGSGEIARLHCLIDQYELGGVSTVVDTSCDAQCLSLQGLYVTYEPQVRTGSIVTRQVVRGDADGSGRIDIDDLVLTVKYVTDGNPDPVSVQAADADNDMDVDIHDVIYMVSYLFQDGPAPPTP